MDYHYNPFKFLLTILFLSFTINIVYGASHYCYVTRSYNRRHYRYGTRSCGWWGRRCRYTIVYYTPVTYRYRQCCSGYSGSYCNIPLCYPRCQNNAVCYAPNQCYCRPGTGGSQCGSIDKCSYSNDCYPGTCFGSNICRCSSSFEGASCNIIRDGGTFTRCIASVPGVDQDDPSYETDCLTPNENRYSNTANLNSLTLTWDVKFDLPDDTPTAPSYILESRPGIISSHAVVILSDPDGGEVSRTQQECEEHDVSASNPFLLVECRDIRHVVQDQPTESLHMYQLKVEFHSTTGGFKRFKDERNQQIQTRSYTGQDHNETLEMIFDLKKPIHCTLKTESPCAYEEQPALGVYPDIVQAFTVQPQMFGWEDEDSGIEKYEFELYQMEYNIYKRKLEMNDIQTIKTWDLVEEIPTFDTREPGVYSILMTVFDMAGNWAKARTLVFVDTENSIEIDPDSELTVGPGVASYNGLWVRETGDLDVQWTNRFSNRRHVNNHFLEEVEATHPDTIDDTRQQDGNRTKAAVDAVNGMTRFEVKWRIESRSEVVHVDDTDQHQTLTSVYRNDGELLVVTVTGFDLAGQSKESSVEVRVDSSAPVIQSRPEIDPDATSERDDMYYVTRLTLRIVDEHSGVGEIQFSLFDTSGGQDLLIHRATQKARPYRRVAETDCTSSVSCYCTPYGECYEKMQSIWIDNCWLVNKETSSLEIAYSVFNTAGLEAQDRHEIGRLEGIDGIGEYPMPQDIGTTRNRGKSVDVIWFLPPSCYRIEQMIITYSQQQQTNVATIIGNATRHTLHGLIPDSSFDLTIKVIFEDGDGGTVEHETETYTFSTQPIEITKPITGGAIAGIIIAVLIFLLLIAALVFMFVRYRKNMHPVPEVIRERTVRIKDGINKRLSRHPTSSYRQTPDHTNIYDNRVKSVALNVAYADPESEDMYIYGSMETDSNAEWKYGGDSLKIKGSVPGAKGKFADIKYGVLRVPNGEKKVVVKMNKAGASDEDKLLMTAKMNYLATQVPTHEFLVNMVGAIPPPTGPMILFENCDMGTLLDWLKKLVKVTGDVEEQMVIFTIQSATGMQHLHDKGILHRRLGVRNVLLQTDPTTKQLRAKLSGFGPLKGEQEGGKKHKQDRIPIKWMAPEQFDKPDGEKRHYSKETDIFAYGILVWEIFSKGETPYPAHPNVSDMKTAVLNGYRMDKPADCPSFMYSEVIKPCWNESPHMRPNFDITLAKLQSEYGSQGGDFYGYDPPTGGAGGGGGGGGGGLYSNAMIGVSKMD